jgi:hypothetical protein
VILEWIADLSPERQEEEQEILEDCESLYEEEGFREWCRSTLVDEPWTAMRCQPEAMSFGFCKHVLPRFQALLRDELAAETAATVTL